MKEPFETYDVVLIRQSRWLRVLATCAPFSYSLVMSWLLIRDRPFSNLIYPFLTIMLLIVSAISRIKERPPERTKVTVRATGAGIQIGDAAVRPFLPRSQIVTGVIVPSSTVAPRVQLTLRRGFTRVMELEVRDEAEGRRLLRTLGLDASQTAARFRVLPRVTAVWDRIHMVLTLSAVAVAFILTFEFELVPRKDFWMMMLPPFLLVYFRFLLWRQSWFEVGTDGVLIRWLWQRRFIAYSEIEAVAPHKNARTGDRGLLLSRRNGEQVWVPVVDETVKKGEESVALLEERIREARERYAQGEAVAFSILHSRKERSMGDWITSLRSIGAGASAAHRVAPVLPERLWRIIEAPSAEPLARAAAAVALGAELDEDGRARLKAAADATVAPKLRVALTRAASATEDAALTEALAELEAAEGVAASIKVG